MASEQEAAASTQSPPPPAPSLLRKLFGTVDLLMGPINAAVPVANIGASRHKHVLFYFSAHWCAPCRRFTPLLSKLYKDLRDAGREDFEIIFVSNDSSPEEFSDYVKTMPFLAIPFLKKKERARLMRKFKVKSLPTLVVLEGDDAVVINKNAVSDAREESSIDKFPWRARTIMDVLDEAALVTKSGASIKAKDLQQMKHFAIYYAAQWSPPCRAFTPQLMSIYKQLKESKDRSNFEIIFVSCDRSVDAFQEFYDDMPWAKIDFQHPCVKELSKLLEMETVPTLITLQGDGTVINKNARYDAADDLCGEKFPWMPEPLPTVADLQPSEQIVDALNQHCCFILHVNGSSNSITQLTEFRAAADTFMATQESAAIVSGPVAASPAKPSVPVHFFISPEHDTDLVQRVLAVAQAQVPPAGKAFVLGVYLAGERAKEVFFADLNRNSISDFAQKFVKKISEDDDESAP